MIDGISLSGTFSQGAIVALSGIIGAIVQKSLNGKKKESPDLSECRNLHTMNNAEHNELFNRMRAAETEVAVSKAALTRIESVLHEIEQKIDALADRRHIRA